MKLKTDFLGLLILGLFAGATQAVEWYYLPSMTVSERYTDNLRLQLTPPNPIGNFITTVSPTLTGGYIADNNELNVSFNWNQLIYHNLPDLNFSEKIGKLNYDFNLEKFSGDLSASYGDQASLGSEPIQLGVNGSGFQSIQVARYSRILTPNLKYKIDEKNSLQFNLNYTDTTFGAHPSSGLGFSDFISDQFSLTGTHSFSTQFSLNLTGGYSTYSAKNNVAECLNQAFSAILCPVPTQLTNLAYRQKSETLNLQLGFNYSFNESITFNGSAGIRDSTSHTSEITTLDTGGSTVASQDINSKVNGKSYSAGVIKQFEMGSMAITATQQLNPASTGTQQQTTVFSANGNLDLSERWSAGLGGSYLKSDTISAFGGNLTGNPAVYNRITTSFTPNLKWQWTPDVSLQFSYTYINQDYIVINQSATSNSMQFQFIYQPSNNHLVK